MALDIKAARQSGVPKTSDKWQYDGRAKSVLKNRTVLACILKCAVAAVKDKTLDEIASLIEDNIEIGIPVEPGLTNTYLVRDINGLGNENEADGEGKIAYDVKFYARLNENFTTQVIINVEAQRRSHLTYDLMNRAIFYAARLISAQKEVEFQKDDYNLIKPVYTIWLCMNRPEDSLLCTNLKANEVYGDCSWVGSPDSMMNIIFIGLKNIQRDDSVFSSTMHKALDAMFSNKLTDGERSSILSNYGIELPNEVKKELNIMSGLGQSFYEEGKEEGRLEGKEEGRLEGKEEGRLEGKEEGKEEVIRKLLDNGCDVQMISSLTGYSEQQIFSMLENK